MHPQWTHIHWPPANFKGSPPSCLTSNKEVAAAGTNEPAISNAYPQTRNVGYPNHFYRRGDSPQTMWKLHHNRTQLQQTPTLIGPNHWLVGISAVTVHRNTHTQCQLFLSRCRGYWQLKQFRVSANNTFRMNDPGQMLKRGSRLNSAAGSVAPVTAVSVTHAAKL